MVGDYCDGQKFQNHPLYRTNPSALQLIIYYDELELCNPLGSRRKKHKIGELLAIPQLQILTMIRKLLLIGIGTETIIKMVYCFTSTGAFYYLLGNLHPRLRSRINTIQLLALAKCITISEYGIDRILEPVIEDIRKLESVKEYFLNYSCITQVCMYIY